MRLRDDHDSGCAHALGTRVITITAYDVALPTILSAQFFSGSDVVRNSVGTLAFYAPEMCSGEPFSAMSTDIWAAGVLLFCLVFGCPPFSGATTLDLYASIQGAPLVFPTVSLPSVYSEQVYATTCNPRRPLVPLSQGSVTVDPSLASLLQCMLEKRPEQRATWAQVVLAGFFVAFDMPPLTH